MATCYRQILVVLIFITALLPATLHAQIFKWMNETGRVHYSDRPQGDSAVALVISNSVPPDETDKVRHAKRLRLLKIMAEERETRLQAREIARVEARRLEYNCSLSRTRLQAILNASYLYEESDNPLNPRVLSFEERARATADARTAVEKWCGNPAGR